MTPLDYAREEGKKDMINYLEGHTYGQCTCYLVLYLFITTVNAGCFIVDRALLYS